MKKLFGMVVLLVLIVSVLIVGCTPAPPPPTPGPQPTPAVCSEVYVVSNSQFVFGTVFVNGIAHGELLAPFGAVLVNRPQIRCGDIVSVYIQRLDGMVSRIQTNTAVPPRTTFTYDFM